MASSSSSSSSVEQKHQVFLSFRGEDTRCTFTSHLHAALQQKGIDVFIDNELIKGEEISQALLTAIQESKIYVIILSENYASSSWFLKELCEILECKKRNEQKVVVPIFYHVHPSDVRNQRGKRFEEAFAKHQEKRSHEVGKWKAALTEVGYLSGHHIEKNVRPEGKHIEEIVEGILKEFVCTSSCDTKGLIGIESRIKEIESMLCFDSPHVNVLVVGIWGMGGIGKTTIANAVFERFFTQFEGWCFLENVKEKYEGVRSREFLFSEILGDRNAGPRSLPACMEDRLRHKRVLIVLDDVDESRQLDLLPEKDCFGRGSRIIVTSRDKQVLQSRVDVIYTVKELDDYEALQLFGFHAFKQSYPEEDFMKLSKEVVQLVKGLPLALRVLGSALYCKCKSFWVDVLKKLKETPDCTIVDTLRISFDALDDDEVRDIFLDIACFFKVILTFEEMNRDYITKIVNGLYVCASSGIDTLIDKSLVTTSYNRLDMHDLVQQMGKAIVCQEHKEPGQRSRLWNPKEICHVLKNKTGTGSVTSMLVDMSEIGEVRLGRKAFKGMKNLRYLKLYYCDFRKDRNGFIFEQGLKYLPETLRYLYWDSCPLKSLPLKFSPENLVELCLPNSHVGKLWNDVQNLMNLKRLDLIMSRKLIEIPDLSRATSLEVMILEGCSSLVEVHSSIRNLNNLSQLFLAGGHRHIDHTRLLRHFKCVHYPVIYYGGCCPKITKFPEIPESIVDLCLSGTAIDEVPSSIGCLLRLRYLCLSYCPRLKRLPSSICKLKSLEHLDLSGCLKLVSFPEILETMKNLKYLYLNKTSIEELPSSIEHLVGLRSLHLKGCKKLKTFPSTIWKLQSLEELSLEGCLKLVSLPEISETMKNLESLFLNRTSIEELPSSIEHLVGLESLFLCGCKKLKSLPTTIGKLHSLACLRLDNCSNITKFPEIPRNLKRLGLGGTAIEQVPSSIKCQSKLQLLNLKNCTNLSGSLPRCIFKKTRLADYGPVTVSGVSKLEVTQEHLRTVKEVKFSPSDRTAETGNMECNLFWSSVHVSLNLS